MEGLRATARSILDKKALDPKALTEHIIECFEERLPFSEDLLFLCWVFARESNEHPLDSMLWQGISKRLRDVLTLPLNPLDWAWFKSYVMNSAVKLIPMASFCPVAPSPAPPRKKNRFGTNAWIRKKELSYSMHSRMTFARIPWSIIRKY